MLPPLADHAANQGLAALYLHHDAVGKQAAVAKSSLDSQPTAQETSVTRLPTAAFGLKADGRAIIA